MLYLLNMLVMLTQATSFRLPNNLNIRNQSKIYGDHDSIGDSNYKISSNITSQKTANPRARKSLNFALENCGSIANLAEITDETNDKDFYKKQTNGSTSKVGLGSTDNLPKLSSNITSPKPDIDELYMKSLLLKSRTRSLSEYLVKNFTKDDLISPGDFLTEYHALKVKLAQITDKTNDKDFYKKQTNDKIAKLFSKVGLKSTDNLPNNYCSYRAKKLFYDIQEFVNSPSYRTVTTTTRTHTRMQKREFQLQVNKLVKDIGYKIGLQTLHQCILFLETCVGKEMELEKAVSLAEQQDIVSWEEFTKFMRMFDLWKEGQYKTYMAQKTKIFDEKNVQATIEYTKQRKSWKIDEDKIRSQYFSVLARLGFEKTDCAMMKTIGFEAMWNTLNDIFKTWATNNDSESCMVPTVNQLKSQKSYLKRWSGITGSSYYRLAIARDVTFENNNCLINSLRVLGFQFWDNEIQDMEAILFDDLAEANAAIRSKIHSYVKKHHYTYHQEIYFESGRKEWERDIEKEGLLVDAFLGHSYFQVLADMYNVHFEIIMWSDTKHETEKLIQIQQYGDVGRPTYRLLFCNMEAPFSSKQANHYRPLVLKNEILDDLPTDHQWGFVNQKNKFISSIKFHNEAKKAFEIWKSNGKHGLQSFVLEKEMKFDIDFHNGRTVRTVGNEKTQYDFFHQDVPRKEAKKRLNKNPEAILYEGRRNSNLV